ncbi:MAG TPA: chemotaxis protein CheW [Gammaproteobacteria bacterium]
MSQSDNNAGNKQQQAIADYLDALLADVNDEPATETQLDEPRVVNLGLQALVAEVPEIVELKTETPVETPAEIEPEVKVETTTETKVEVKTEPVVQSGEPIIPDWAEHSFQCLLFKVSGLTLAVPLVKLNGVIPWNDKIVWTPNKTDWYLGLVQNHGKNVKIIDTALMVLPENRRGHLAQEPGERFSHILLVDDSTWGLACDSIGDVIWLTSDKVKWRNSKQQRPWLAGTAIEQMCALMDTEVFADMLNEKAAV